MNPKLIWFCYILGAVLTLIWKLGRYCYAQRKAGKSVKSAILEWFFEGTADNAVSWAATIGAVWVIGSIYINHLGIFNIALPLPLDYSIAFTLGGVMEVAAPNLGKWATQKISSIIESKTKGANE